MFRPALKFANLSHRLPPYHRTLGYSEEVMPGLWRQLISGITILTSSLYCIYWYQ